MSNIEARAAATVGFPLCGLLGLDTNRLPALDVFPEILPSRLED
jgi:hypothetical protein